MALNSRQRKAIENYLAGMTKEDAMLDAGYSESMAKTRRHDVFNHPEVEAEIERRQKIISARSDVSLEWIVEKLKAIASADLGDIIDLETGRVDINKLTPELRIALTGYNVDEYQEGRGKKSKTVKRIRIQQADKLRALELLIRHLGLSKEKQVLEVNADQRLVEILQSARRRTNIESEGSDGR